MLLLVRLVVIFVVGMVCIFAIFACVTGRMNGLRFGPIHLSATWTSSPHLIE